MSRLDDASDARLYFPPMLNGSAIAALPDRPRRPACVARTWAQLWAGIWICLAGLGLAACADATANFAANPNNAASALAIGIDAADGDDDGKAVMVLTAAIEGGGLGEDQTVQAYYWRGVAYNDLGRHGRAIADLDTVLETEPENDQALATRGMAQLGLDKNERALYDFDSALALQPANKTARFGRGLAFLRSGDDAAAIADFTASLHLDRESADAYRHRGFAFLRARNYRRAAADFTNALVHEPANDLGYYFRGFAKFFAGDHSAAVADFAMAASQKGPDNGYDVLAHFLAVARARSRTAARASLREYDLDRNIWPGPLAALLLGEIGPAAALTAARHEDPKINARQLTEAHYHIGQYHLLAGDRAAAATAFAQAVNLRQLDHVEYLGAIVEQSRLRANLR